MRIAPSFAAATLALSLPAAGETPSQGANPAAAQGRRVVNLKNMSCDDFLGLSEGERTPVLWYIAGDYKEAGRMASLFDLDLAGQALPAIWKDCKEHPQANLRYRVVNFFKAHQPKPPPRK